MLASVICECVMIMSMYIKQGIHDRAKSLKTTKFKHDCRCYKFGLGHRRNTQIRNNLDGLIHPIKHIRISQNKRNERFVQASRPDTNQEKNESTRVRLDLHPTPVRGGRRQKKGERSGWRSKIPGSRRSSRSARGRRSSEERFAREVGAWGIYRRVASWSNRTASVGVGVQVASFGS